MSGATLSRALTRPPLDVLSQVFADGAPGFPFQALHAVNMDGGGSTTLSASPDWPTQPAQVQQCCCWDSCCGRLMNRTSANEKGILSHMKEEHVRGGTREGRCLRKATMGGIVLSYCGWA